MSGDDLFPGSLRASHGLLEFLVGRSLNQWELEQARYDVMPGLADQLENCKENTVPVVDLVLEFMNFHDSSKKIYKQKWPAVTKSWLMRQKNKYGAYHTIRQLQPDELMSAVDYARIDASVLFRLPQAGFLL